MIRCARCCLRYESSGYSGYDGACPHCRDPHVGVGRSFDEACLDAVARLRREGKNQVWKVGALRVYTADVTDRSVPDVNLVHMVRLAPESSL